MVEGIRRGDIPGVQIRLRTALAAASEDAWGWVAQPERWRHWLAASVGEREAACRELREEVPDGEAFHERITTLERAPGRWTASLRRAGWEADTRVTVRVVEAAGGCELSILHEGFQRLPLSIGLSEWEAYRHRWRHAVGRLASALAGESA